MCGITGFIDRSIEASEDVLKTMTDALTHRGPDQSGYVLFNSGRSSIALGHRRLSILDLSELGRQPMSFEHLHLCFNGEVYNFSAVAKDLQQLGYVFSSQSDTEVVLKAFHAWGIDCIKHFRGMFAFAIYDRQAEKVFLFRDRAGVKPLYYAFEDGRFLFASELKALAKHPRFNKSIDKKAISLYMQFGYISAPYAIFENTFKLKPGHFICFDVKNRNLEIKKYWDVSDYYRQPKLENSELEILDELECKLKQAFKLRMVSDVPVGIFLSGGIDSSVVTALLQKEADHALRTFSIGFAEEGYNEAHHAKKIAAHLKTDHTEYYCNKQNALDIIPELPHIYDEPFGDSSAIATILVSRLAKEKVSVVLSGDGGDESFCGYSKYFALNKSLQFLPAGFKREGAKFLLNCLNENAIYALNNSLPENLRQSNIREKFPKFRRTFNVDSVAEMFYEASSVLGEKTVALYYPYAKSFTDKVGFNGFTNVNQCHPLDQMMAIDYQTFLPDDILVKVDRATMSCSLEGREPLLDHHIIEYLARVPVQLKYKNGIGKYLLKEILYRHVPKAYFARPKAGFRVPLFEWLKGDLKHLLDHYLDNDRLRKGGLFDADAVEKTRKQYYAGKYINIYDLWFILMFEMWREHWDV